MAPHWKCGSRQRVAGSNPALSARPRARGPTRPLRRRYRDARPPGPTVPSAGARLMTDVMRANGRRQRPRLVVIIPAYNEEPTIARAVAEVPRHLPGVSRVEGV